jgi:hypothetical protein
MFIEIGYTKFQERQVKAGVYKSAPRKSVEDYVGQSQKYVKDFYKKYFPGFSEEGIKSSYDIPLSKLVDSVFNQIKINPKTPPAEMSILSRVEYAFLDISVDKVIADLTKKGFSKTDVGKVVLAHILRRIDAISTFADTSNITLSDVDNFESLPPPNKFATIASEMVEHGFFNVDNYYRTATDITRLNAETLLKNRKELVKKYKKTPVIADKVDHDIARHFFGIQSKEFNYDLKRSEEFKFAFEQGLKYLRYCHKNGTQPVNFAVAAESIATLWKNVRDNIPGLVSSNINALTFWGTQLGRSPSDQDLKNLGITRGQFKSMVNHVFDERLRHSEASAFSLSHRYEAVRGYTTQPERVLLNTVKALLESNRNVLKVEGQISLMILVNDHSYLKVQLPTNASDEMIMDELNGNPSFVNLNAGERYNLKLDAYKNPKKRSKQFKDIYGFKGSKSGYGDYIVRLTTKGANTDATTNKSVTSMYTVGPYKALIDVDMDVNSGLDLSIKASHHNFDGVALTNFFDEIRNKVISQQNDTILIEEPKVIQQAERGRLKTERDVYPLPSAMATTIVKDDYHTTTIKAGKKIQKFTTPVLRGLDLALANNVSSMHVLYNAGHGNNPYSNARWDNVQPVVISVEPLKPILAKFEQDYEAYQNKGGPIPTIDPADKKRIIEYAEMVNNAITWAKRGFSTVAVLSSPFGTMRNLASNLTSSIYENVKMLNQSNGMLSPTVSNEVFETVDPSEKVDRFETADSNAYEPEIDVGSAKKHLGVIGSQAHRVRDSKPTQEDTASYTIKKSPNQAQLAFKEALVTNPRLRLTPSQQANVIKVLDEVLKAWEKVVFYEASYKYDNPITGFFYEDYYSLLKRAVKTFSKSQYLGKVNLERLGITNQDELQSFLNDVLIKDAQSTIDPAKLSQTHSLLTAFFEAVNRPSGKTGPLTAP